MINDYVCNNKESIFMNMLEYEKKQSERCDKSVAKNLWDRVSCNFGNTNPINYILGRQLSCQPNEKQRINVLPL